MLPRTNLSEVAVRVRLRFFNSESKGTTRWAGLAGRPLQAVFERTNAPLQFVDFRRCLVDLLPAAPPIERSKNVTEEAHGGTT